MLLLLLLLLIGCAETIDGTWLFSRTPSALVGDECVESVTHDFVGAYLPATAEDDSPWTSTETAEPSAELFFGRIEADGKEAVVILGSEVYPGTTSGKGAWRFTWTHANNSSELDSHESGYQYSNAVEAETTLTLAGTFAGGEFTGTWEDSSQSLSSWTESDTWSEDVAATVGTTGRVPASSYLLRLSSDGTETAATNDYTLADCDVSGCLLTVSAACGYSDAVTGTLTELEPQDGNWSEDAGQSTGI